MRRVWVGALMLALTAGCTAADPPGPRDTAHAPTATRERVDLVATPRDRVPARTARSFTWGDDGSLLMTARGVRRSWTWYRVHEPDGSPRTPLLRVKAPLIPLGAFDHRFLLGVEHDMTIVRAFAVGQDGTLRRIDVQAGLRSMRRGDRLVPHRWATPLAYRPVDQSLFVPWLSSYQSRRVAYAMTGFNGSVCDLEGDLYGGLPRYTSTLWSDDHGLTWHHVDLTKLLPDDAPPPTECRISNGRVLLHTIERRSGDPNLYGVRQVAYTVDLTTHRVTSYRLPDRVSPYEFHALPDGRMVFLQRGGSGTEHPRTTGLLVATDATNTCFELRPTHFEPFFGLQVNGRSLLVDTARGLRVTHDVGRTWRPLDLKGSLDVER